MKNPGIRLYQVEERVIAVLEIEDKLKSCQDLADLYNTREVVFSMRCTDYPELNAVSKKFEPYSNMWKACADFSRVVPEWMDGSFTKLDPESMSMDVETWLRTANKSLKTLKV